MKTQNPLIGRSSGSFASSIFQTQYGTNIVRSKPVEVRNPNTSAQQLVREKMTAVAQLLKLCFSFFNITGWSSSLKMPWFSFLTGYAFKNAVSGTLGNLVIDYSKLSPAPDAHKIADSITLDQSSSDSVLVEWTASDFVGLAGTDYLVFMLIDNATGSVHINSVGTLVSSEQCSVNVPGVNSGKTFTLYARSKSTKSTYKPGAALAVKV